jgi:predicted 2-oxoglutarate/Fe(II)-dependent dioxygenase YbiX
MLTLTDVVPADLLAPRDWAAAEAGLLDRLRAAIIGHPMIAMAVRPAGWSAPRLRLVRPEDGALADLAPATISDGTARARLRADLRILLFLAADVGAAGGRVVVGDPAGAEPRRPAAGDCLVFPAAAALRVEPVERGTLPFLEMLAQSHVRSAAARSVLLDLGRACALLDLFAPNGPPGEGGPLASLRAAEGRLLRLWSQG